MSKSSRNTQSSHTSGIENISFSSQLQELDCEFTTSLNHGMHQGSPSRETLFVKTTSVASDLFLKNIISITYRITYLGNVQMTCNGRRHDSECINILSQLSGSGNVFFQLLVQLLQNRVEGVGDLIISLLLIHRKRGIT